MSKIGVRVKIDVSKIDKARLYRGQKGTYLDATVFIDPDNPGQYGDHGMITQDVKKEERDNGVKGPILGNVEVFWRDGSSTGNQATQQASGSGQATQSESQPGDVALGPDDFDNVPF